MDTSDKPFGNAAMAFHDSTVSSAQTDGPTVTVVVSPAYIHRSDGAPGIDSGTGWLQKAVIVLHDCQLPADFPSLPLELSDGVVITAERTYDGIVPLPLSYTGLVRVDFSFESGAYVVLSASEIRIDVIGEATYLEEFQGGG